MEIKTSELTYTNPIGESGTGVRGANRHNSALRVYAFESQHKASQRRQVENKGFDVKQQTITLKVASNEEGHVVVVGGETNSQVENVEGQRSQVNDVALLSNDGGMKGASAAFFGDSRKSLPQLYLFDSFASRLKIESRNDSFDLNKNDHFLRHLMGEKRFNKTVAISLFDKIENRLNKIDNSVKNLQKLSPFTNKRINVTHGMVHFDKVTNNAVIGETDLQVRQTAKSKQVAFDVVPNNNVALGLGGDPLDPEGTFYINGVSMQVKTTDTIVDIKNLINYGEDSNNNGRLDFSEDKNFNGQLDPYEDVNANNFLDSSEDLDADGILDQGEDRNLNGLLDISEDRNMNFKLDTGTQLHGVYARIVDNKLILQSTDPDGRIFIEDDDRLLQSLGLIEIDYSGESVFKNEIHPSQKAIVDIDGELYDSDDNHFKGVIDGVDFTVSSHLQDKLKINVDLSVQHLLLGINEVIAAYNSLQQEINSLVSPKGYLRDSIHVNRIKSETINAFRFDSRSQSDNPSKLSDFGLTQSRHRVSLDELSILNADQRISNENISAFDRSYGLPTVRNTMGHFGISDLRDATLNVDGPVLSEILELSPTNAENNVGSMGFTGRLEKVVATALLENGGHLSFAKDLFKSRVYEESLLENISDSTKEKINLGTKFNLVA